MKNTLAIVATLAMAAGLTAWGIVHVVSHDHLEPEPTLVGHFHWPGCHEPPCPPPLDTGPRTFTHAELAELLHSHPNLCKCALLCPAKCVSECRHKDGNE